MLAITGPLAVVLIYALCEILNKAGLVNKKFTPLVAIVIALPLGIYVFAPGDIITGIVTGVAVGLAATGTHSGLKNVVEGLKDNRK